MPVYNYKAFKEDGAAETGVIDADSPKDARLKLKGRSLHVTELEAIEREEKGGGKSIRKRFFRRRRLEEVAVLTRQMATLLDSGIPLIGALSAVIEQVESRDLKAALMDVREMVSRGGPRSEAMAAHGHYFSDLVVNMIRAGEAGGNLDKVMYRVADYLHAQNRTRARVVAALTYPVIMLVIGVGVVVVLLTAVVPKIMEVINRQHGGAALPLPTEILLMVSGFMGSYWWALAAVAAAAWFFYRQTLRTSAGRLWIDTMKLRIPVLGNLLRKASVSRFALTFGTLLESGLPVLEALAVVKKVVDNALLADTIEMVRQKVAEGADIATPLKNSKVFPPVVGYMIAVGEESGRLEDLLKKMAQAYDEEVELAAQKLTALLEPMMIVVMAFMVGFIVLAILLPILQMSNI